MKKRTENAVKFGCETVVFHSVLKCFEEWRTTAMNPADCKQAVEQLRGKVKSSQVALTKQMLAELEKWESGDMLTEVPEPAATAPEPDASPAREPAASPAREPAASAPQADASTVPLLSRAREAKRRRMGL